MSHDRVHVPFETGLVRPAGGCGEFVAPPGDGKSAQDQALHARRKHHVSGLDGVPAIPQLMGKADLPLIGMALLCPV